ncbi:enhancer of mRNA-decapping protein 3 [Leptonychotes weddellii]|uniref:Enhancer of mRNA-decapping protein 3 n=1 Tax=Leptonychotes weddellii TaxID=9713 RepID=A0A7F8Q8P5_LEPWE|nr:enhancer of mRNA-decapping protein 3 [Leptonychotes weddellii]
MATDWLGSIVSINCGDSLGVYQGRVSAVDQISQTISLTRPFHNGVKCLVPEVTFRAGDITELKILEIPGPGENQHFGDLHQTELGPSGVGYQMGINQNGMGKLVKKPASSSSAPQNIPKRTDVKSQDVAVSPQQQQCSKSYVDRHTESLSQSKSFRRRHNSWSSSSRHPNQATPKKSGLKNGQMKNKDDECFGDDIEEIPDTDFDFEGNLALFDKAAVFEEIDTYERRSGTRSRGIPNERPTRYRHDENILESEPIVYRRITVPHNVSKEFCTETTCTASSTALRPGGSTRMSPPGLLSAYSDSHVVFFPPSDLPSSPVDLVINCLDCPENAFLRDQPWYKAAVAWANRNRAPVLSIDPPVHEGEQGIDAKWSLALGLPLPLGERAGRIYLCDIGLPQQVFQEVGISYHSPFGCKFVIPLHSA